METNLFADSALSEFLESRLNEFKTKAEGTDDVSSLIDEYHIDPIVLDTEKAVNLPVREGMMATRENHFSAGDDRRYGEKLSWIYDREVPFTGFAKLFFMKPNGWCSGKPAGSVDDERSIITVSIYDQKKLDPAQILRNLDTRVLGLNPFLQKSMKDVTEYNEKLEELR